MAQLELRELLEKGDLFHIWGEAGTGKTLLACALTGEVVKDGHVRWICTDGKRSFVKVLRANVRVLNGNNVTISVPTGHDEVREVISSLPETIHPDTSLIVVDPITRALDMSRKEVLMWGRELVEESLPSLVALTQDGIKVVLVSEVRCVEEGIVPVMHNSISVWKPVDLHMVKGPGRDSTILEQGEPIARLSMDSSGVVRLTTPMIAGRQDSCSESHSTA